MGKSEETCRFLFQHFVQRPFIQCRPRFLHGLELDGYCRSHEIAFEYNGIQHSQFHTYFHRNYRMFEKQLEKDKRKNELCKKYGLVLMTIPHRYTFRTVYPMAIEIHRQLLDTEEQRKRQYMVYRCPHVFSSITTINSI